MGGKTSKHEKIPENVKTIVDKYFAKFDANGDG